MTDSNTSIRTPLGKARGLGSARDGVHHWWMQRVSALALMLVSLYFLTQLNKGLLSTDYVDFIVWSGRPVNSITLILFIIASFYHAMLGFQVVIEDYVHSEGVKVIAQLVNKFFFGTLGIISLYAVLYINFGIYG